MMHLAVSEDDVPKAESLVARVGMDYADSTMFAVAHGDSAAIAAKLRSARDSVNVVAILNAVWQVGGWLQRPDAAEPFARAGAARAGAPPRQRERAALALAEVLIQQGRWTAADSAYVAAAAAAAGSDPWPTLARGLAAGLPFLAVPRPALEAIRADVSAVNPAPPAGTAAGPASALLPQLRTYTLGILASRLGESESALRLAGQLDTATVAAEDGAVVRALGSTLRADVALATRRPADAVTALQGVKGAVPLDLSGLSPYSEDYSRLLRAEALLALGRDDEARTWFENGFGGTPDESELRPEVAIRLGDLYERKGDRERAVAEYARFVRLWAACDTRLRPAVDDARARLARLTAEPRS